MRLPVKPAVFCCHYHLDTVRAKFVSTFFYMRRFDLQISAALFIINLLFLSIHQLHYRLEGLKDELRRNRGYNSRVTITAQRSCFPFANIALRYGFGLLLFLHFVEDSLLTSILLLQHCLCLLTFFLFLQQLLSVSFGLHVLLSLFQQIVSNVHALYFIFFSLFPLGLCYLTEFHSTVC